MAGKDVDLIVALCERCHAAVSFDAYGRQRPMKEQREWTANLPPPPGWGKKGRLRRRAERLARKRKRGKASKKPPKWGDPERYRRESLAYAFGDRPPKKA